MRWSFIFRLAVSEFRSQKSRTGFLILSIFLGVASLVAVNAFSDNLKVSVELQSKKLKGSDLSFSANRELPDSVNQVIDSLVATGMEKTRITQFLSMAINPVNESSRLIQVRAVDGRFPWYGDVVVEPAVAWTRFQQGKQAVVDEALQFQLNLEPGDSIRIGQTQFEVIGFVKKMAGDTGFGFGVSARVWFADRYLEETGLIQYGSRVRYQIELAGDPGVPLPALTDRLRNQFRQSDIRVSGYLNREQMLGESIDRVTNFLGLVSLIALLMGGIGVASSIHVFIRQKMDTVAILRCLGATGAEVAMVYLLVSVSMASLGIAAGVAAGLGIQYAIPVFIQAYLPIDLYVSISWTAIAKGVITGLLVTLLFSLFPLRHVLVISPLNALRKEMNESVISLKNRWLDIGLPVLFVLTLWGLSVFHASGILIGTAFVVGILVVLGVLYLVAWVIVYGTRLLRLRQLPYPVRQAVSNLYRPNNQTVTLVLSLGFGVFLLLTVYQIQKALLDQLSVADADSRPNLILFDIQKSQTGGLEPLLDSTGYSYTPLLPLVPARIAEVNGRLTDRADTSLQQGPRNELMATYRWDLLKTETVVDGAWWTPANGTSTPEMSVEENYARRQGIRVGDTVGVMVLGVARSFQVTSLRKVNWVGMSPNFLVVVKPGVLDQAPQTFMTSLHIDGTEKRSEFQKSVVNRYPNIMALDLTLVIETVDSVLQKISLVIQFMGLFSILTGLIVVAGAVSNGRIQRIRETALLRTLGAVKATIRQIFTLEFMILGLLASITGLGLSVIASQLILTNVFTITAPVPFTLIGNGLLLTVLVMTGTGWLINGNLFRQKPLEVLRYE